MAKYSAIKAAVDAYIKQNGRKEITGRILNSVLNATIDSLGRFFQFAGGAIPADDPGTPDQNVCYLATEPGVYTNFGGITIEIEEVALLFWNGTWTKQRILIGIREVTASVDNNVGTPSVDVSYSAGVLVLTFHNLKGEQGIQGETGASAGFGTIGADITGGVGTPGVSVETSGGNDAKNIMFHFTNLKGEQGVTSVVATIDNTSGTPSCQVSLVNGVLTLAFSGLKGLKGDTGVSADYPITIYNGLDSDATDQALAAAQGKVLDGKITQLEHEVIDIIPSTVKRAIYTILDNVAFANDDGYSSELAIVQAWAENLVLVSIDAVFTQGGNNIYATDSLDKLKQYLVVTANYDDSSSAVLGDNDYTLSGTLTVGTSTITVTYGGKTDTFTVTVSASPYLYVLPNPPFASTGGDRIDTGFTFAKSHTYTFILEATTSTSDTTYRSIFGNRLTNNDPYMALQLYDGYMWGCGLTNSGKKKITVNTQFRVVVVFTLDATGAVSAKQYRNRTGTIEESTNSYTGDYSGTSATFGNMILGDSRNNGSSGFLGSISYFAIFDGEMQSTDIMNFLDNGV